MRASIIVLAVALAACAGRTEAGPIGKSIDLRQFLPDSLRAATEQDLIDSTYHAQIPVGPDSAKVELTWTSFHHGSARYLGSVAGTLVAPVRYDSLALGDLSDLRNRGSRWVPEEEAKIRVAWYKRGLFGMKSGVMNFTFAASGYNVVGPAARR